MVTYGTEPHVTQMGNVPSLVKAWHSVFHTQVKPHPKSEPIEAAWLPHPTSFIRALWRQNEGVSQALQRR